MPTVDLGPCECCGGCVAPPCEQPEFPDLFVVSFSSPVYTNETLGSGHPPEVFAAAENTLAEAQYTVVGDGAYFHGFPLRCDTFFQADCQNIDRCVEVGRQMWRINTSNQAPSGNIYAYSIPGVCIQNTRSASLRLHFEATPNRQLVIDQPYTADEWGAVCDTGSRHRWRVYGVAPALAQGIELRSIQTIITMTFPDCEVEQPVFRPISLATLPLTIILSKLQVQNAGGGVNATGATLTVETMTMSITPIMPPP